MIEKKVDVKTADGTADCEFFYPSETGTYPGVIYYPDIGGLRDTFRDMAKRLAGEGFAVLVPNFFYRASRLPVYHTPFQFGEEKTSARMNELRAFISPAGIARDAEAFVAFLSAQKQVKGKIGVAGYCMGGGMAMRAAAAVPDKIAAAVSFHGSQLASDAPDSPHTLSAKIKGHLLFGFAEEDRTMPPEAVTKLKAALDAAHVSYEDEVYPGSKHGWCVKDHSVYDERQAERAWANMVRFFKKNLG